MTAAPGTNRMTMTLLDIRDELAVAKNLAAALHLACDARSMPSEPRAALCEACNVVLERLMALITALDQLLVKRAEDGEADDG